MPQPFREGAKLRRRYEGALGRPNLTFSEVMTGYVEASARELQRGGRTPGPSPGRSVELLEEIRPGQLSQTVGRPTEVELGLRASR